MSSTVNQSTEGPQSFTADWRPLFSPAVLKAAEEAEQAGTITSFSGRGGAAFCESNRPEQRWIVRISGAPEKLQDSWTRTNFTCTCPEGRISRCMHQAQALLHWEKQHGPWVFKESESEWKARVQKEEKTQEEARRAQLREKLSASMPALTALSEVCPPDEQTLYHPLSALSSFTTTAYAKTRLEEIMKDEHPAKAQCTWVVDAKRHPGDKILDSTLTIEDRLGPCHTHCSLIPGVCIQLSCDCGHGADVRKNGSRDMCEHQLELFRQTSAFLRKEADAQPSDSHTETFLAALEQDTFAREALLHQRDASRIHNLALLPTLHLDKGELTISFSVYQDGGLLLPVRSINELLWCTDNGERLQLTKFDSIDFKTYDFRSDSLKLLDIIRSQFREIQFFNEELMHRTITDRPILSTASTQPLSGAFLDEIYDLMSGKLCDYTQDGQEKEDLFIGYRPFRLYVFIRRLNHPSGFGGVAVNGALPSVFRGLNHRYVLRSGRLSRLTEEESAALAPFEKIADPDGRFSFQVNLKQLPDFYYRSLPLLKSSPVIYVDDRCEEEAIAHLPPQPVFDFYADLQRTKLYVRATVHYGERAYVLGTQVKDDGKYRDLIQENRVLQAIRRSFTAFDARTEQFSFDVTDDSLFAFLQDGVPLLQRYGTIHGTDAFRQRNIRKVPDLKLGVTMSSGIMNMQIDTGGMSTAELMSVLESYRLKKSYHKTADGQYVSLLGSDELETLRALVDGMDLNAMDIIRSQVHLPVYRALYLERMLKNHHAVVVSRDDTYRALVERFQSYKSASDPVPECLQGVLRPYQVDGFHWMNMLRVTGFGGILADEMGLGKTIQTIALLESERIKGVTTPSLVVCPSSLIFNWQEEIRRFAPLLTTQLINGPLAQRKAVIESLAPQKRRGRPPKTPKEQTTPEHAHVYITSYDQLRRDIAMYEPINFHICVLDEGQFVKNQKAAIAQSVKLIHADHRFALTGTPIENRLAELWSLFDFIMPGYLFSADVFTKRFEGPITREHDLDATERLRNMVSPFILRRTKNDVLSDLPPKMEEIVVSHFDEEQALLYRAQVTHMRTIIATGSLAGADRLRVFNELLKARQICCDPALVTPEYHGGSAKREACMDLIRTAMDGGHRMLIFSQFVSMLRLLEQDLKEQGIPYFMITGETPKDERLDLVHSFNEGTTPVFLISLKAGGFGLNLTGADTVIHYDPWWNLAVQNQATDRAHRIGQTKAVMVYKMIVHGTIEEKIVELQNTKQDLADSILSGSGTSLTSLSKEELLDLIS
ncbi:MAG: DEAD/DEAH box helicase [Clostridia bacterium]|nr:DEAD/DEAH box helicase [Clostridia bacterium]